MSKITKLREAIDHLEQAETLLLEARRGFSPRDSEWDILKDYANSASQAAREIKTGVLAHAESEALRQIKKEGRALPEPAQAPK